MDITSNQSTGKSPGALRDLFSIDYRSLALIRVLTALLLIIDIINRARFLYAHYTNNGVLPLDALQAHYANPWYLSLHAVNGSLWFQALLFLLAGFFACMLLVGWRTRIATIASFIFIVSLHNRNPLVLQGGDVLLRLMLFWGMFLPWGRIYSIDAVYNKVKEKAKAAFSGGTAAFLLQVGFVYLFNAFHKSDVIWRVDGTAVYYALSIDQFTTPLGYVLLSFPLVMMFLSLATFWMEALAPLLLFSPVFTAPIRMLIAPLLILMHGGFALFMQLGLFPFIDMAAVCAFLPTPFWDWLEKRLRTSVRKKFTLYYDSDCGFCLRSVQIIRMFFLIPETKILPASSDDSILRDMMNNGSWVVVDHTGARHFAFDGAIAIARHSPLLWPFAPLMRFGPVHEIGSKIYRFVADHRRTVCLPEEKKKPSRFMAIFPIPYIGSALALFFIAYILLWNIGTLNIGYKIAPAQQWIGNLLRLDQHWAMFAPYPLTEDGWYIMPGTLRDGSTVDVFTQKPVTWERPKYIAQTYPNQRWRKYLMNLWMANHNQFRVYFGDYMCRRWNAAHPRAQQLKSFDMMFILEYTRGDYTSTEPSPVTLWEQTCAG